MRHYFILRTGVLVDFKPYCTHFSTLPDNYCTVPSFEYGLACGEVIHVVAQFVLICLCFWVMVMYDNEFTTTENKI